MPKKSLAEKTKASTQPVSEKKYITFYLIMLVLGTVSAALTIPALVEVPKLFQHFSIAPLYAVIALINILASFVMIAGLVLLYQKRKLGLYLTLGSYATGLILVIAMAFTVNQVVDFTLATMTASEIKESGGRAMLESFMQIAFYGVIAISSLITPVFMVLWYLAWQKQYAADHPKKK